MKKLTKFAIGTIAATAISFGAQAELISTDFKEVGDARATLHQETGLEWLDLDYTLGMTQAEALSLTGSGGELEGFRLPTLAELEALLAEIFPIAAANNVIDGGWAWQTSSVDEAMNFRSLFAETRMDAHYQYGLFGLDNGTFSVSGSYISGLYAGTNFTDGSLQSHGDAGVWLVSDGGVTLSSINDPSINANNANAPSSVPLSSSITLMSLALAGFGFRRKANS